MLFDLNTTLFLLVAGLFASAFVVATVLAGIDFSRMPTPVRVGAVVVLAGSFVLLGAFMGTLYERLAYQDAFSWFCQFAVSIAVLIAEVLLLKSKLKTREADEHEGKRSPERYQPTLLRA